MKYFSSKAWVFGDGLVLIVVTRWGTLGGYLSRGHEEYFYFHRVHVTQPHQLQ